MLERERLKMKKSLLLCLSFLCVCLNLRAQEDVYQAEIGGGLGPDFYLGDVSSTPFKHPSAMIGGVVRKIFNPRMAIKGNLAFANLRGKSDGYFIPVNAYDPSPEGGQPTTVSFKRNVVDLGAQFEFNFFGFGIGEAYKGNKRITPYLLAGLGFTLATGGGGGTNVGMNFPVGAGVKYKWKPRVNVGAEWTFRFTTMDTLDKNGGQTSLAHPYAVSSVGLKNKDAYSFFMLFLTYDICPKCKECHNNK